MPGDLNSHMDEFSPSWHIPFSYTFTSSSSSTSGSYETNSSGPWMDSLIWSKLPSHILDRVVAFLPPPAFFRLRCVCKHWYFLLFSNSFHELYNHTLSYSFRRCNWFMFFKHKTPKSYIHKNNKKDVVVGNKFNSQCEGYLFDPYELQWYRLSFGYIPSGFYPSGSSGGLLCWVSEEAGLKTLLLCNPLVGSFGLLPQTSRPRLFPSIGFIATPSTIYVTVAGDDFISPYAVKNLSSESFFADSDGFSSIWATSTSLPRLCSLETGKMTYVQGKFYCTTYKPFSVLSYNMLENQWFKIQTPMTRSLQSPSLVENRGKLVLVAAVDKSSLSVPKSLRLWSLQDSTSWVEIGRMPSQLYVQFAEEEGGKGFDCVGNGEFVVISFRQSSDKSLLLFDTSKNRWQWVPPCPYGLSGSTGERLQGFAYEPMLVTPVTAILDHLTFPASPG